MILLCTLAVTIFFAPETGTDAIVPVGHRGRVDRRVAIGER